MGLIGQNNGPWTRHIPRILPRRGPPALEGAPRSPRAPLGDWRVRKVARFSIFLNLEILFCGDFNYLKWQFLFCCCIWSQQMLLKAHTEHTINQLGIFGRWLNGSLSAKLPKVCFRAMCSNIHNIFFRQSEEICSLNLGRQTTFLTLFRQSGTPMRPGDPATRGPLDDQGPMKPGALVWLQRPIGLSGPLG